ncbi:MAG: HAD family phosphatase [Ekhidna sp.]|nr:HAD family phosphatase [Ekhidna sp.]
MLRAVIFDMDGVIVESEPLHHKAYYAMFDEIGITVSSDFYSIMTGKSTINLCRELKEHYDIPQTAEELVSMKRRHYDIIFENDKSFDLIEGVRSLIEDYWKNDLTLVLASSSSMRSIDRIFTKFDLNQYFKAKISGAELEASKPHPEIFLKATEATGFKKEECFVIEDATNGIEAAKGAGLYCVAFDSVHTKKQDYSKADRIISNFNEISFDRITKLI